MILFHPKGSIDPKNLLKFRPLFEQGYDLIVASRVIAGSLNEEDNKLFKPRKWFVVILLLVARLLWKREGDTVWDVLIVPTRAIARQGEMEWLEGERVFLEAAEILKLTQPSGTGSCSIFYANVGSGGSNRLEKPS
jgi:hypothetical protein